MPSSNKSKEVGNDSKPNSPTLAMSNNNSDVLSNLSWDTYLRHDPRNMSIDTVPESPQEVWRLESTSHATMYQDDRPTNISINTSRTQGTDTDITIVSSNSPHSNPCCVCCNTCSGNSCCRQSSTSTRVSVNITSQPDSERQSSLSFVRDRNPDYPWISTHECSYSDSHSSLSASVDDSDSSRPSSDTERSENRPTRQEQHVKRVHLVLRDNDYTFETIDSEDTTVDEELNITELTTRPGSVEQIISASDDNDRFHQEEESSSDLNKDRNKPDSVTMKGKDDDDILVEDEKSVEIKEDHESSLTEFLSCRSFSITSLLQRKREKSEKVAWKDHTQEVPDKDMEKQAQRLTMNLSGKTKKKEEGDRNVPKYHIQEVHKSKMKKLARSFSKIIPKKTKKKQKSENDVETDRSQDGPEIKMKKQIRSFANIISHKPRESQKREIDEETKNAQAESGTNVKKLDRRFAAMLPKKGRKTEKRKSDLSPDQADGVAGKKMKKLAQSFCQLLSKKLNENADQDGENNVKDNELNRNMKRRTKCVRETTDAMKETLKNIFQGVHKGLLIVISWMKKEKNCVVLDPEPAASHPSDPEPVKPLNYFDETAEKYRQIARQLDLEHHDYEAALRMYERAMNEMKKTKNTANKYYGRILFEYGVTLHKLGRRTESVEYYARAELAGFSSIEHDFSRDLTAVRNTENSGSSVRKSSSNGSPE